MRKAKPEVESQVSALSQLAKALRFDYSEINTYQVLSWTLRRFRRDQMLSDGRYLQVSKIITNKFNYYIAPYCEVKQVGYDIIVIPNKQFAGKYGDNIYEKLKEKAREHGYR